MKPTTVLLQKITAFEGKGLDSPEPLDLTYIVPQDCAAGVRYVHVGNASAGIPNITLLKNGLPMRHIPVSAGGAAHVNLAVVDDLPPGTGIEVVAAGEGTGTLIVDVGITETAEQGQKASPLPGRRFGSWPLGNPTHDAMTNSSFA